MGRKNDKISERKGMKKYIPLILLILALWLIQIVSFPLLKNSGPMPGQEGYSEKL